MQRFRFPKMCPENKNSQLLYHEIPVRNFFCQNRTRKKQGQKFFVPYYLCPDSGSLNIMKGVGWAGRNVSRNAMCDKQIDGSDRSCHDTLSTHVKHTLNSQIIILIHSSSIACSFIVSMLHAEMPLIFKLILS